MSRLDEQVILPLHPPHPRSPMHAAAQCRARRGAMRRRTDATGPNDATRPNATRPMRPCPCAHAPMPDAPAFAYLAARGDVRRLQAAHAAARRRGAQGGRVRRYTQHTPPPPLCATPCATMAPPHATARHTPLPSHPLIMPPIVCAGPRSNAQRRKARKASEAELEAADPEELARQVVIPPTPLSTARLHAAHIGVRHGTAHTRESSCGGEDENYRPSQSERL